MFSHYLTLSNHFQHNQRLYHNLQYVKISSKEALLFEEIQMAEKFNHALERHPMAKHKILISEQDNIAIPSPPYSSLILKSQPYCPPIPNFLLKEMKRLQALIKSSIKQVKLQQQAAKDLKNMIQEERENISRCLDVRQSGLVLKKTLQQTNRFQDCFAIKQSQLKELAKHGRQYQDELIKLGLQLMQECKFTMLQIQKHKINERQIEQELKIINAKRQQKHLQNIQLKVKIEDKLYDVEKARFHIYILNIQLMKNLRPGLNFYLNPISDNQLINYTALQSQQLLALDLMEIVYYVTSNLYPRFRSALKKAIFNSRCFEILLRGDIQPRMTGDLKKKVLSQLDRKSMKESGNPTSWDQNIVIIFAQSFSDNARKFKDLLFQHLLGFNNQIIKVLKLETEILEQRIEQVNIIYTINDSLVSRSIYIVSLKNIKPSELLSLFGNNQNIENNELNNLLENRFSCRKGYLLVEAPLLVPINQIRIYNQLIETLKRQL